MNIIICLIGISEDVAKWITETRTLVGVGIDTPSIDPGAETKALAHRALAAKNIFILENVNMERTMPSKIYNFFELFFKLFLYLSKNYFSNRYR